ncbi:PDZ domain-containing protein [Oryzobacter sp. R7]|uniref:YlbL family protein n=1 Tax=Oryzobacter faecalis TaxID=3388656 RepID=UPI00398CCB57
MTSSSPHTVTGPPGDEGPFLPTSGRRRRRGSGPARPVDPMRPGRLAGVLLTTTFTLIALGALLSFVGLPYVVMSPGPATNILGKTGGKPLLEVEGAETYPTEGRLDFTTVSVRGGPGDRVTIYEVLQGWLSPFEEILPVDAVFPPDTTEEQAEEEGAAEMADSQNVAAATALRALGRDVGQVVAIAGIPEDSPSKGLFEPGDVLVSVDGDPASSADAVRAAVQRHAPGDTFPVVVRRGGTERTVSARTAESEGRTVIGVGLRIEFDLPVDVTLNTGSVGGPSAGLMFSLAIYDVLTPGALTGGEDIAGTGTMEEGGLVGPIGGIRQKLVGARTEGAEWFLAPAENCDEVVGHVPDGLRVVRVATFEEGRAAVEAIARDDTEELPACR